jgi:hypothetical protein
VALENSSWQHETASYELPISNPPTLFSAEEQVLMFCGRLTTALFKHLEHFPPFFLLLDIMENGPFLYFEEDVVESTCAHNVAPFSKTAEFVGDCDDNYFFLP